MSIDWAIVGDIAKPLVGVLAGFLLARVFERRARVVSYFLHSNAIEVQGDKAFVVHTHSVVVRNVGKKPATNLRLTHQKLPSFSVFPNTPVSKEELSGGMVDLVFPLVRPGEQFTISYLYFPPLLFSQIHAGIKHDDGFALPRDVVPMTRFRPWQQNILLFLIGVGVVALLYAAYEIANRFIA